MIEAFSVFVTAAALHPPDPALSASLPGEDSTENPDS
jgi:hypothetical protein